MTCTVPYVYAAPEPGDGRHQSQRPHLHLPECGTITGYNKGCGCTPCRDASATARRAQRLAQRTGVAREIPPPPPRTVADRVRKERPELNLPQCGTPRGYQLGCGCIPCREAKAAQRAAKYQQEKAKPGPVKRYIPNVLPPDLLMLLRAAVACVGCGAVRQAKKSGRGTTIRHRKGCTVRHNREGTS